MYVLPEPPHATFWRMHVPPSGISYTLPPSTASQPATMMPAISRSLFL